MARGASGSGDQEPLGIGLDARGRLRAVALDTNAIDRGQVNIGKLTTLATRLKMIGLPVWIPEPVAWEWAEHAGRQWEQFTAAASQPYTRLRAAGIDLPPLPFTQQTQAVQDRVLAAIRAIDNLVVIPLSPANALEGVKDQILQRPPGRLKATDSKSGPVKTGASDSAWLRDLRERADGDLSQILLVSGDRDVVNACTQWGVTPPLLRNWPQLLPTLFDFTLDDDDASVTRLIIAFLRERLGQTDPAASCGFTVTGDPGQLLELAEDHITSYGAGGPVTSATVTELTAVAGIMNVTVQEPDPAAPPARAVQHGVAHSAQARVFFLGTVDVLYLHDGRTNSMKIEDVLVCTEMSFEIRDGGAVIGAESLSEAAVFQTVLFDEPEAAFQDLLEAFSTIPGLSFPDEWPTTETELRGPGGEMVIVELRGSPWTDWTVTVSIGDDLVESAAVSCEHAEDVSPMWRGPDSAEESWEPPVQVVVQEGDLSYWNPAWSLAAWMLARLSYDVSAMRGAHT
ncbi:hypothetical protein AB0F17_35155 [Nonomuraea sp. NPDC026600]|uniref:hypothetical protein n=1 Tax=Nonomuraea sp. NPDC026600 TaxID=3155363 RepID=UPI0033DCA0AC